MALLAAAPEQAAAPEKAQVAGETEPASPPAAQEEPPQLRAVVEHAGAAVVQHARETVRRLQASKAVEAHLDTLRAAYARLRRWLWAAIEELLEEFAPWLKWIIFDAALTLVVGVLVKRVALLRPLFEAAVEFAVLQRAVLAAPRAGQQQPGRAHDEAVAAAAAAAHAVAPARAVGLELAEQAQEDDEAALLPPPPPQQQLLLLECSVAHHPTYRVPAAYIRACPPDGAALCARELLAALPGLARYQDPGAEDWTFLTPVVRAPRARCRSCSRARARAPGWSPPQPAAAAAAAALQEHPLLRAPCLMLHPCQTAARMELLLQCAAGDGAAGGDGAEGSAAAAPAMAQAAGATDAALLAYMRGWASLVAGPLGLRMLQ
ncbi:hypothetical protein HT031_001359 [Scenedesmus sp. PABB004]|nr:hypothetical protein HT031_001359 [Scenedesmus sp. PABB004]